MFDGGKMGEVFSGGFTFVLDLNVLWFVVFAGVVASVELLWLSVIGNGGGNIRKDCWC